MFICELFQIYIKQVYLFIYKSPKVHLDLANLTQSMNFRQLCQQSEESKTVQKIIDIELKMCQILNVQFQDASVQERATQCNDLNLIHRILMKICNKLLKNDMQIKRTPAIELDKSDTFVDFQQINQYQKIQDLLQKQENKNRLMLRKQFQFKQYQNTVLDELNEAKNLNRQLQQQINKLTQDLQQKTLQIMHLRNKTKAYLREYKDIFYEEKTQKVNTLNLDKGAQNHFSSSFNESLNQQKKMSTSRLNAKSNGKKNKDSDQKALYALYNNQKKNHSQTINVQSRTEKMKRKSVSHYNTGKKTAQKQLDSVQFSNKKSVHTRRRSEQFSKKTAQQKQVKIQKGMKKKKQIIYDKIKFL